MNRPALVIALIALSATSADTLHLKNGGVIQGEVLRKKADKVLVDLGFTVLSVPMDEIDRIAPDGEAGPAMDDHADLYRTAPGQGELTVKENVDRVGESVVEIRTSISLGSGFVIHPSGYVITNDHVVAGEHKLSVTLFKKGPRELEKLQFNKVRIVATNAQVDLALLKIEDAGDRVFQTVPLGDSDPLKQGQNVFAVGSPLGLERSVSQGIISLKNRPMWGMLYIQTTTQINPGNSGGPLFNLRGEVVGVNNMKLVMSGVEGMGFAIPANTLKGFVKNRDAFAFDPRHPNAGFRYGTPPKP
jgi:serine protease Do